MAQRRVIITAPTELLAVASELAIKHINSPTWAEFIAQSGKHHFLIRGIKAGVSIKHLAPNPSRRTPSSTG